MLVYATVEELEEYLSADAPADAERLLKRASQLIATYITAPYRVDDDGMPTDVALIEELRDAVCAQIEYWMQTGDEADVLTHRDSVSFPGALSVSGKGRRLAPRAADALGRVGLLVGADAL